MAYAQTVGLNAQSTPFAIPGPVGHGVSGHVPPSGPGWHEIQELSSRLEAVEAENRWLRDAVSPERARPLSTVTQTEYQESCGDIGGACDEQAACTDCNWLDRVGSVCKDGISWNNGKIRLVPYGYVAADMIASEKTYAILGGPLFLLPAVPPDVPDSRFTFSAQQTTLGCTITGPDLSTFQSSANVAFNFFGDRPVQNNPGVFFMIGYVQLRNDRWRLWAGQDPDALGRQNTNSPSWTTHKQSGNFGQIRPGFRAERFFHLSDNLTTSIYAGLTQQVVLDFIANPTVAGTDNGWPNIELRWEVGLGPDCGGQRPLMFAVGGLVGETRAVDFSGQPVPNVSTTWAVVPELRSKLGRWGFQGEAFVGDALGTYNAGIGQSLNLITDEPIYSVGGFGEVFYELTPSFTVGVGYGVDDPRDADLAPNQRSRNETYWANAIWRLSEQWETRFEVAHLETDWMAPSVSNDAMQYLLSVRFNF